MQSQNQNDCSRTDNSSCHYGKTKRRPKKVKTTRLQWALQKTDPGELGTITQKQRLEQGWPSTNRRNKTTTRSGRTMKKKLSRYPTYFNSRASNRARTHVPGGTSKKDTGNDCLLQQDLLLFIVEERRRQQTTKEPTKKKEPTTQEIPGRITVVQ